MKNIEIKKKIVELNMNVIKPMVINGLLEKNEKLDITYEFISYLQDLSIKETLIFATGLKLLIKHFLEEHKESE